jgi:hypothetical protein
MRSAHTSCMQPSYGRAQVRGVAQKGSRAAVLLLCTAVGGCASARVTQFHAFAEAGRAYVKASQVVLDEAGSAAIDTDSVVALKGREALDSSERRKHLLEQDKLLNTRLLLLRQIGRHAQLLESYFATLQALADSDAPETAGLAAKGVFDSVAKLSPGIRNASIGGVRVEPLIPPATSFVVGRLKLKALERELEARSQLVERELALQEAALKAITSNLETDLLARLKSQQAEVANLYASEKSLGEAWLNRRRQVLEAQVSAQSAGKAAEAAAELRTSFVALVERRLTEPSIQQVIANINSVLDLIEQIRKTESEG